MSRSGSWPTWFMLLSQSPVLLPSVHFTSTITTFIPSHTRPSRRSVDSPEMESSPVVKAHDHAAAAASADTTVAINEHTLAAGEFANAARNTTSVEALRTLKLLEEHHRRLAELLNLQPDPVSQTSEEDVNEKTSLDEKGASTTHQSGKKMPSLTQKGFAAREMSSSIASNLASARGIRSKYRGQPLSPSVSNDQAPGNVDPHPRRDGSRTKMQSIIDTQPGKPTWVPPMAPPKMEPRTNKSAASSPRVDQTAASAMVNEDAGYARFYNTFGSLINKISAPLAFAGLPLIQEEPTPEQSTVEQPVESSPPKRKASRQPPTSLTLEPDLSKIYSKATMRALAREGHSTNDSFYVVPTTGHTMSYANILTYAEKEKRRLGASLHSNDPDHSHPEDEDDDFVDARETPVPVSPGARRRMGLAHKTEKDLRNTIEELGLQNKSLKDTLDVVSKRLHAFEASSQNSAMALAESYRILRPGSPSASPHAANVAGDEALRKKTLDMEEQLAAAMKQMERLEKDNRKMQKTLDKYREKWEVLKAGAKARREGKSGEGEDV
ncbi:hypothetical protein MAC_09413 [Metarhizium acridum CQMa 102]|uniref:Uncharacterized protein n=1 Tax=Metarhizium acridum (strain CQMa 102) TaxID=655827 RepID=E9EHR5_METAQ|nr:uncharacterized protein MAC_09413 [Metarhizium acridum CQMa 102]EFY84536.1 hypothetical protein MAC_09413 [Metarhizium acridum CQMa 102]